MPPGPKGEKRPADVIGSRGAGAEESGRSLGGSARSLFSPQDSVSRTTGCAELTLGRTSRAKTNRDTPY